MVQEFNVLRCFACKTFQVHLVKKAKQWACKVCGEKQSLKKIHGQGNAPDCRKHVQKLNRMQGEYEQMKGEKAADGEQECSVTEEEDVHNTVQAPVQSKWEKFVVCGG
ncbi:hypothetical protein QZH41_019716 [Actinostola sp. cb2023]|nr:hypothetical protein QZH41_019716 [Actinostola sp. cb2023]